MQRQRSERNDKGKFEEGRGVNFCHCGDHAWTPITKGFVALVSPEDAHLLKMKWRAWQSENGSAYAIRNLKVDFRTTNKEMGACVIGRVEGRLTDHINNNSLDNRRRNLRHADPSKSSMNRRNTSRSKHPLKGVWVRPKGRFSSQIRVDGKRYYLGMFDTAEEAHAAYVEAAARLHGDFANLG